MDTNKMKILLTHFYWFINNNNTWILFVYCILVYLLLDLLDITKKKFS
jgi:hypothetical protein